MPKSPSAFHDALSRGVLVFDGAMGTEIYRHHVFTNRSFDELCLSDPKLIETIHRDYCDAGADVLTTNTFGAQRLGLEKYGLADKVRDINRAGAAIARRVADAADRPVLVAGSIGPWPRNCSREEAIEEMIVEQVAALVEGGADFIIFETQPSRAALEHCAAAMRRLPGRALHPLLHAVAGQGESAAGEPVERLLAPLPGDGPQPIAWGMNCGTGPDGLLGAVERAVRVDRLAAGRAAQRGHPQGSRESADLLLLARISDRICQAVREPGRVGRGRLLRNDARAHPRDVPPSSRSAGGGPSPP